MWFFTLIIRIFAEVVIYRIATAVVDYIAEVFEKEEAAA